MSARWCFLLAVLAVAVAQSQDSGLSRNPIRSRFRSAQRTEEVRMDDYMFMSVTAGSGEQWGDGTFATALGSATYSGPNPTASPKVDADAIFTVQTYPADAAAVYKWITDQWTNDNYMEQVTVGTTTLGKAIKGYCIRKHNTTPARRILFTGAIHGNEKITVLYLLDFLRFLMKNKGVVDALESEVCFIPIINVDGYDRTSRKNANLAPCVGACTYPLNEQDNAPTHTIPTSDCTLTATQLQNFLTARTNGNSNIGGQTDAKMCYRTARAAVGGSDLNRSFPKKTTCTQTDCHLPQESCFSPLQDTTMKEKEVSTLETFFSTKSFNVVINYHSGVDPVDNDKGAGCILPPVGEASMASTDGSGVEMWKAWKALCADACGASHLKCIKPSDTVGANDKGCGSIDGFLTNTYGGTTLSIALETPSLCKLVKKNLRAPVAGCQASNSGYSPEPFVLTPTDWEFYNDLNRDFLFLLRKRFSALGAYVST